MELRGKNIGIGFAASHCTFEEVMPQIERLVDLGGNVIPIVSVNIRDTKFGQAQAWLDRLTEVTGNSLISTVVEAEPLGPKKMLDAMLIAPCTGNTLSRLANAITDGPILMAAKATLRNQRPVVLAVSSNDILGLNAANLARLLAAKNVYFVPFGQDDPQNKPNSMVAKMERIPATLEYAMEGKQVQPILVPFAPTAAG